MTYKFKPNDIVCRRNSTRPPTAMDPRGTVLRIGTAKTRADVKWEDGTTHTVLISGLVLCPVQTMPNPKPVPPTFTAADLEDAYREGWTDGKTANTHSTVNEEWLASNAQEKIFRKTRPVTHPGPSRSERFIADTSEPGVRV